MQEYKAIQFSNGDVVPLPKGAAIDTLVDSGKSFDVLGTICRRGCTTNCFFYANGTCPCIVHRDMFGELMHIFPRAAIVPPIYWEPEDQE